MNISEFIEEVRKFEYSSIPIGQLIDLLNGNTENWALTVKALIVSNPRVIEKYYLIGKLQHGFKQGEEDECLDFNRRAIYEALKNVIKSKTYWGDLQNGING